MKQITKLIGLALLVVTLTTACKKKDKEPEGPSVKELLTDTPWEFYMWESYSSGTLTSSGMGAHTYEFRTDNTLKITTTTSTSNLNYELTEGDDVKIRVYNSSNTIDITYLILKLDEYDMVWQSVGSGSNYTKLYFNK